MVVGPGGSPAFVGLGTSVPGFRGRRRSLAAVHCQAVVRPSLELSRGVDEGEADECLLDPGVRKWSLGVTEVLGGSPWVAFMA